MRANAPSIETGKPYRYRPVLFFAMAYLFTWIFWVPAIFVPQEPGGILMLIGLLAPAVVSTVFVLASGSELLKQDLKIKIFGFYKVKWRNVLLAILQFAGSWCAPSCSPLRSGSLWISFRLPRTFRSPASGSAAR